MPEILKKIPIFEQMKIALIGYGKMGKAIEEIALQKGHEIVLKATSKTGIILDDLKKADVAIEFTNPHSCVANIETCIKNNIPVVIGSTGWYDHLGEIIVLNTKYNGSILHATNFSVGVNLFFSFNATIAKVMSKYSDYNVDVHEIHHTQKLDAPSGTGITTAETILKNFPAKHKWVHEVEPHTDELLITHERIDNVPGTHVVNYRSEIDDISISHVAHNRKGFAGGAVIAAEWLLGKKGVFTMRDVLNIEY